jgi:putative sigma-54 modulation protein
MRLELTGRHIPITVAMRRLVQRRLAHLERLVTYHALSAQVVITRERSRIHVEITLHARQEHFLHCEATAADWEEALNEAAAKIERQAQKLADKRKGQKRLSRPARTPEIPPAAPMDGEEVRTRIIRARGYAVKPMSVDDAALQVGEDRNAFLVFRNASNDAVTVLYRRPDGHLGLIEPEG